MNTKNPAKIQNKLIRLYSELSGLLLKNGCRNWEELEDVNVEDSIVYQELCFEIEDLEGLVGQVEKDSFKCKKTSPLKYTVGEKVYFESGKKMVKGIIVKAEERRGMKPYTVIDETGSTLFFLEKQLFYVPKVEKYKGCEIRTIPNGTHYSSLIYRKGKFIGGTFSGPLDKVNSIQKAKFKIDNSIFI